MNIRKLLFCSGSKSRPKHSALFLLIAALNLCGFANSSIYASVIDVTTGDELTAALEQAQDGDTIQCNPTNLIMVTAPFVIDKEITLLDLSAKLRDGVGDTEILYITADNVHIADAFVVGNLGTIDEDQRTSLIKFEAEGFVIERVLGMNCLKDVICIQGTQGNDVNSGTVRDITGINSGRDVVSIAGRTVLYGSYVRNVTVDRIKLYKGITRGCVEVSDGSENITVNDVYAENSLYGVDIQTHNVWEQNRNISVSNVEVKNCAHAIRMATKHFSNHDISIKNVHGSNWSADAYPIQVHNAERVHLEDIYIDGIVGSGRVVDLENSTDVTTLNLNHNSNAVTVAQVKFTGPSFIELGGQTNTTYDATGAVPAQGNVMYDPFEGRCMWERLDLVNVTNAPSGGLGNEVGRKTIAGTSTKSVISTVSSLELEIPMNRNKPFDASVLVGLKEELKGAVRVRLRLDYDFEERTISPWVDLPANAYESMQKITWSDLVVGDSRATKILEMKLQIEQTSFPQDAQDVYLDEFKITVGEDPGSNGSGSVVEPDLGNVPDRRELIVEEPRIIRDEPITINVVDGDWYTALDYAQDGDTIQFDPNYQILLNGTIQVDKSVNIYGLNAKLMNGVGNTEILYVTADGVHLADVDVTGNIGTITEDERTSLIKFEADDFIIERVVGRDCLKDVVNAQGVEGKNITKGIIRDITGYNIGRDVVSIAGREVLYGSTVSNVLIERIKCFGSVLRGAVEVSDGSRNITVNHVYAEDCLYGVDIQTHKVGEKNIGIHISNVEVKNCTHAIRMATKANSNYDIAITNVIGSAWTDDAYPIQVKNAENVTLNNIHVVGTVLNGKMVELEAGHNVVAESFNHDSVPVSVDQVEFLDTVSDIVFIDGPVGDFTPFPINVVTDPAPEAFIWNMDDPSEISPVNMNVAFSGGVLTADNDTGTPADPRCTLMKDGDFYQVDAADFTSLQFSLYLAGIPANQKVVIRYRADGTWYSIEIDAVLGWHDYEIDLTTVANWQGTIERIRLDFVEGLASAYEIQLDWVKLLPPGTVNAEFNAWSALGNDVSFDGDANNDGIADGVAWLLGSDHPDTPAGDLLPKIQSTAGDGVVINFRMLNPSARGTATVKLQYSNDLGASDPWAATVTVPDTPGTVDGLTFAVSPVEGEDYSNVQVTMSETLENDTASLFVRLLFEK